MQRPDLTVATNVLLHDGIGRQGIGLIETLHENLNINSLLFEPILYSGITNPHVVSILSKPLIRFGKVTFWTYILGLNTNIIPAHQKSDSDIKIAYSMFESDAIPELWRDILNKFYDVLVVPDPWLVNVYRKSGVQIPIFVLPLGIMIPESFFSMKKATQSEFTFGMTGGLWERKNHIKTMLAFNKAFGLSKDVKLRLHGRFGPYKENLLTAYAKLGAPANIEINCKVLNQTEYAEWMNNLDCYVFISSGEGYSITPREFLALGRPCILSNNTAHKSICDTGLVTSISATEKRPAYYEVFGKKIGNFFEPSIDEAVNAMLEMKQNYAAHLQKVQTAGPIWTRQFLWSSLKAKYLGLIKPTQILFGKENLIKNNCLETNSRVLFKKYKAAFPEAG